MVASRSARQRKAATEAGPLARVRIDVGADHSFVYKIGCTTCSSKDGRPWATYRPGENNGYLAAMDRWILHVHGKHPGDQPPCMAYLPEAQGRLQERRDRRERT
ncbi:hypothetical protein ABFT23_17480 [Nocardioides sp. C4-1]|uniref:hypothetical protein n=1 Tax=Nocardioides sp. C4-1 TaxID=3151851 RepID=UPI0032638F43